MTPNELKAFEDGVRYGVRNMEVQQLKAKKSVSAAADYCKSATFLVKVKSLYVKNVNEARRKMAAATRTSARRPCLRDDGFQVTPAYSRTPSDES